MNDINNILRFVYDVTLATGIAVGLAWVLVEWACQ